MALISKYIWFDGKLLTHDKAKVPVTSHAIHYGTSVFEGIRAYWNAGNLVSDLHQLSRSKRKEFIKEFSDNVDIMFDEATLNKIEALYGTRHRQALQDSIRRMKSGSNKPSGGNRILKEWNDWITNSIGTIMFFNRRSAITQLLSTFNFINWSDNNPLNAALAFANQAQFWKDFTMLFNSNF